MAVASATLALEEYQWWKRNKVQNLLNQKLYCENIFPNLTAHKLKKKKKGSHRSFPRFDNNPKSSHALTNNDL